nr:MULTISPECIES: hypothetical protein [unclassified Burkholderia]
MSSTLAHDSMPTSPFAPRAGSTTLVRMPYADAASQHRRCSGSANSSPSHTSGNGKRIDGAACVVNAPD